MSIHSPGPAEKGPRLAVREDDVDEGQRAAPLRLPQDRVQAGVEATQQTDAPRVKDPGPALSQEGKDGLGPHPEIGPRIGVEAAVLAADDEDEIERRRDAVDQDGLGADPRRPQLADEEIAEHVAAGREDGPQARLGEAEPDEVRRDVAGVTAEGMTDRAEDDPSRRGRAFESAGDEIDDGDSGDKDHGPIVLNGPLISTSFCSA
jgi:hypothetical protein